MNIKYLGHSSFLIEENDLKILIDPFISGNSNTDMNPLEINTNLILVSHDHQDHIGDTIEIARNNNCTVICPFELGLDLAKYGLNVKGGNIGGTLEHKDIKVTFVRADHVTNTGAVGYVIKLKDHTIYFAGDTGVFSDMKLIKELYNPDIVILPIGSIFTMGPKEATLAVKLLEPKVVIPMHYNTFPTLTGTPSEFKELLDKENLCVELITLNINEFREI